MFTQAENHSAAGRVVAEFEKEALPHADDLFRTAVLILQDQNKAVDAVQETYRAAWNSVGSRRLNTTCKAWLYQILLHVVRRERRGWLPRRTGGVEEICRAQPAVHGSIPQSLTNAGILAAVDKLPIQFREVLLLADVAEFSYQEASEILQVPAGTVMSRLQRARALLCDQLSAADRLPYYADAGAYRAVAQ